MAERVPSTAPSLADRLAAVLRDGGLVIMPCDTIYGVHGLVGAAEERIRRLKGRDADKPFIQLLGHKSWVARLSDQLPDPEIEAMWPGPLTLVLRARAGGTVAVRVPSDSLVADVLGRLDRPLFSTSVNTSGLPPLTTPGAMEEAFGAMVDLIVDAGPEGKGLPSTIVDVTRRPYRVIRQGALIVPSRVLSGSSASSSS